MSAPIYRRGGATTFNLSSIYSALGLRDARVIPNIEGGQLVPVISLGEFRSFAPEVVEARGLFNTGLFNILGGQWVGALMLSVAEGGSIIEQAASSNPVTWNLAPARPFTGGVVSPYSQGGAPLANLVELTGINLGAFPIGSGLGGTNSSISGFIADPSVLEGIWVPPGWFFWAILENAGGATANVSWRWREIPEGQGSA